ncbi:MAG: stage 0 sporulation family protein [candidate division KSB1 bacterium]|nr:stage 0 sporulation family protein [candidate division KSB1 bacterium]MDZ7273177.1 stage 0 sporulation family protein [candidate division KSB1 bacterium]MDZ7285279.1 stage 0 sporulation family protein [candidate division KSB1 bacterium]MDZ7298311.1 stage 0 sporulation family protein [candidate division KSB1 bacterium]MDZ7307386.1 stage 0 sporulation family protein [candidate division KSB1 bacterium]
MQNIIQVKFKEQRKGYYQNPEQYPIRVNDFVIVEAEKGEDLGVVKFVGLPPNHLLSENEALRRVLRKATDADLVRSRSNRMLEKKAFETCRQKIVTHSLDMKLVGCEYQFDGNKITFYFTAEKRVDFRELVKDLAAEYRTRIELRQIGVRDEAKRLDGYGVCGRRLCCSSWIDQFAPITTQAAKEQNLPLNPNKLAGLCGRLKCCLMYEREFYNQAIGRFPELAKEITTDKGRGTIIKIDIFHDTITVKYPNNECEVLPLAEAQDKVYKCQNDCGHAHGNREDLTAALGEA